MFIVSLFRRMAPEQGAIQDRCLFIDRLFLYFHVLKQFLNDFRLFRRTAFA